jgi:hypothetical protein
MGVIDDHNRQHTYGNSLGPPTSIVGVSAQQAIDANKRLAEGGTQNASSGAPLRGKDHLKLALAGLIVSAIFVLAAYIVGGIGAVALGLIAFISGLFGIIFLIAALIDAAKAGVSKAIGGRRSPPRS